MWKIAISLRMKVSLHLLLIEGLVVKVQVYKDAIQDLQAFIDFISTFGFDNKGKVYPTFI